MNRLRFTTVGNIATVVFLWEKIIKAAEVLPFIFNFAVNGEYRSIDLGYCFKLYRDVLLVYYTKNCDPNMSLFNLLLKKQTMKRLELRLLGRPTMLFMREFERRCIFMNMGPTIRIRIVNRLLNWF